MSRDTNDKDHRVLATRYTEFQNLMRHRVNEVLLVSSLYDSFILAQDGQIHELMLSEYTDLNLYNVPGLTRAGNAEEALELIEKGGRFDLIITTAHIGDMSLAEFARKLRAAAPGVPLLLLAYDDRDLQLVSTDEVHRLFERVFLWQGDFRILLAMVKSVEDRLNVEHDTQAMGVQVILLVEDNIRFYSSFLPMIFTEVLRHSQNLLSEGMNLAHKILRMRARPKILHCDTFEEAMELYLRYEKTILGVITDIEFAWGGEKKRNAGAELTRRIKERRPDIPMVLESFQPEVASLAKELGVDFLLKGSATLLQDLRAFMLKNFGFGDFVFYLPDGRKIDRATDMKSLEEKLRTVPEESILYHAERDHFSTWLKARTEFGLADRLKPRKVTDFPSVEALRREIIDSIRDFRRELTRGIVADFRRDSFDPANSFAHIGGGSMGGKARGIAFLNRMIQSGQLASRFPGVRITVPGTVVLCTEVFDEFLERNDLRDFALQSENDEEILRRFSEAKLPHKVLVDLTDYLSRVEGPIAVRSSSLLEDSHYQPFAGVYKTVMLPNLHPDLQVRMRQLTQAIQQVYASTFTLRAKSYIAATPYRLEEEKMAVVLERLIGRSHGRRYYPDISGVARSHNFYPTAPMTSSDGIAAVALGLGTQVVGGGEAYRFCPKYPRHTTPFGTPQDLIQQTQKEYYAMHLPEEGEDAPPGDLLRKFPISMAEEDGTLHFVGSVYSPENDAIHDGLSRPGVRVVTFAPILKHKLFPLAEILETLLTLGEEGLGQPVELEFAVDLSTPRGEEKIFAPLQIRPLVLRRELEELETSTLPPGVVICRSSQVLGIGRFDDISDIVVVDPERFRREHSSDAAAEIGRVNARLLAENRPYLLIGVGRWGSADPWLGIPVTWDQISGAQVIIEASLSDIKVTPSQGAHFFHNLTSLHVGYITVDTEESDGMVDWEWLRAQPAVEEGKYVRHLRVDPPILALINSRKNLGIILKPGVDM